MNDIRYIEGNDDVGNKIVSVHQYCCPFAPPVVVEDRKHLRIFVQRLHLIEKSVAQVRIGIGTPGILLAVIEELLESAPRHPWKIVVQRTVGRNRAVEHRGADDAGVTPDDLETDACAE